MSMDCIIASLHSVECLLCKERNINVCVLCQIVQDRTHVFLNKDRGGLAIHLQEGSSKRGKRGGQKVTLTMSSGVYGVVASLPIALATFILMLATLSFWRVASTGKNCLTMMSWVTDLDRAHIPNKGVSLCR